MPEKEAAMQTLHDALAKVPEQFQAQICTQLTQNIYIALQTIAIVKQAG